MESVEKRFQHLKIRLEAVLLAAKNFSKEYFIGEGGFGKVYKGELLISNAYTTVALKRLNRAGSQGDVEFWREVTVLSLYKHNNIVSLLGFCDENDEKILIYDYASKGSLDTHLNNNNLTWAQRLKICIGAACGLAYLHSDVGIQERVLHRDMKSANILLYENWNAKITDLGLSTFGRVNKKFSTFFTNPVGTLGYVDPLYIEKGLLTKEADVYSFGVVLFEVLCGRMSIDINNDRQRFSNLVRECYEHNQLDKIIYGNIKHEINPSSLKTFTAIAYRCLEEKHEHRPSMNKIVEALKAALKQQTYFASNENTHHDDYKRKGKGAASDKSDGIVIPFQQSIICVFK